jgi:molecular chaperone GrpE
MNDPTEPPVADEPAAEPQTDAGSAAPPETPPETLEQAQARADNARDQMLRAHADMENLRRRYERELQNAVRYGIESLVGELLPVRDSLQEGLKAAEAEGIDPATALDKIVEGMRMTLSILDKALTKAGLSEVHPQGEPFNPELHQALSLADSAELPPNHVVHVVQTGYRLHDRLVRPAMVIVSK